MMHGDLRVESAKTQDDFRKLVSRKNALPWHFSVCGSHWQINNHRGDMVIDGGYTSLSMTEAAAIVVAVNTCGGYRARAAI